MSFSREYAHRPPLPTAGEILEDFNSSKNSDFTDPVFMLSLNELNLQDSEYESDDKDLSPSAKREEEKRRKEITNTYSKVAEFLQQNKNLRQSITSMNELSKELYTKKENLTQLISNIKENMQSKYNK